jgi:hypothetical protein
MTVCSDEWSIELHREEKPPYDIDFLLDNDDGLDVTP